MWQMLTEAGAQALAALGLMPEEANTAHQSTDVITPSEASDAPLQVPEEKSSDANQIPSWHRPQIERLKIYENCRRMMEKSGGVWMTNPSTGFSFVKVAGCEDPIKFRCDLNKEFRELGILEKMMKTRFDIAYADDEQFSCLQTNFGKHFLSGEHYRGSTKVKYLAYKKYIDFKTSKVRVASIECITDAGRKEETPWNILRHSIPNLDEDVVSLVCFENKTEHDNSKEWEQYQSCFHGLDLETTNAMDNWSDVAASSSPFSMHVKNEEVEEKSPPLPEFSSFHQAAAAAVAARTNTATTVLSSHQKTLTDAERDEWNELLMGPVYEKTAVRKARVRAHQKAREERKRMKRAELAARKQRLAEETAARAKEDAAQLASIRQYEEDVIQEHPSDPIADPLASRYPTQSFYEDSDAFDGFGYYRSN